MRLRPGWPWRAPFFLGGVAAGSRLGGTDWLGGIEEFWEVLGIWEV